MSEGQLKFRLRGRVLLIKGRWYSVVTVTGLGDTDHPGTHHMGPEGGLATEEEAMIFYYEKVKPALEKVAERAREAGGSAKKLSEPTLH